MREPGVLVHEVRGSQPPFDVRHSSMSVQVMPMFDVVYPALQTQTGLPTLSVQVARGSQPPLLTLQTPASAVEVASTTSFASGVSSEPVSRAAASGWLEAMSGVAEGPSGVEPGDGVSPPSDGATGEATLIGAMSTGALGSEASFASEPSAEASVGAASDLSTSNGPEPSAAPPSCALAPSRRSSPPPQPRKEIVHTLQYAQNA